ncbi:MAG: hypothetical protein ABI594_20170 [Ginsengibacter sp.]
MHNILLNTVTSVAPYLVNANPITVFIYANVTENDAGKILLRNHENFYAKKHDKAKNYISKNDIFYNASTFHASLLL